MSGRFLAYILVYISNLIIILAVIGPGHSLKGIRSQSEAIELQEEYNERMKQLLGSMPAQDRCRCLIHCWMSVPEKC